MHTAGVSINSEVQYFTSVVWRGLCEKELAGLVYVVV